MVQTEDGASHVDVLRTGLLDSFQSVLDWLVVEIPQEPSIRTVIVDSLDWLEKLVHAAVCEREKVDSIERIDYGRGYVFAEKHWKAVLAALDSLRASGKHVVCIAHSKIEAFKDPALPSYDLYTPSLHKRASAALQQWADEVLFASHRMIVKRDDERAIGVSCGERVLYTTKNTGFLAKNRIPGIPDELPLNDFELYKSYIIKGAKNG